MAFRLLCKAKKPGFYGDRMHYPAGDVENPKRAGNAFALLADGLRYDMEGRMEVDKDLKPILPLWVIPQEEVKKIDPKTPHVIVNPKPKVGKRRVPQEVLDAQPKSWPENVQRQDGMDPNRVVRIKPRGQSTDTESED